MFSKLFDFKTLFEQKMCIYENILCKILHKEITQITTICCCCCFFVCLFSFALCFLCFCCFEHATMKCFSLKICFEGLQLPLKKTPVHVSSFEFWKIFKNISFVERIWVTASLNRSKYGFVYLLVMLAMLVYWFTFIKKN